jgi:hypothetical protein
MSGTITRRAFMAAVSSAAARPRRAAGVQPPDEVERRVHDVLRAYDAQGPHRTGTDVDRQSGEWLRDEVARAGAETRLVGFELDRLDVREASVRIGDRQLPGLPLFDAEGTDAAGVEAPVGATGIHVVTADRQAVGTEGEFLRDARSGGSARAIVVITASDVPGLVPSNARWFAKPYGCPVIQVSADARAALETARSTGTPVRVTCHTARTRATAFNVVAEVAGEPALAPVVVITPRSGWWACAAERGGGLACWLETIRAAAARRPARSMIFLASSGHELGHLGLDAFLHAREPLLRSAHAWIHLGANIGAGDAGAAPVGVRLQASHDEVEQPMAAALTAAGAAIADRLPRARVPAGEARNLHLGGARYVSLIGQGNRWFHHADDRYPRTVTAAAVARYARAVAQAAVAFAQE